jgi:hypothetical protein
MDLREERENRGNKRVLSEIDVSEWEITCTETCLSYGPPWAHYLGGYQDRLLSGPLGQLDLRCTAPDGVKHKDYGGEVLG